MNIPWTDYLKELGLAQALLKDQAPLPELEDRVGRGLAQSDSVSLQELIKTDFEGARFLQARLSLLNAVGLSIHLLSDVPHLFKLSSSDGSALAVLDPHSGSVHFDPDDPGTLYLQLAQGRQAILRSHWRCGVLLDQDAHQIAQLFLPLEPEDYEPIASPVESWVANDAWLSEEIARTLEKKEPLGHAYAVGIAKRLSKPESTKALLLQVLQGDRVESLARPHEWLRKLTSAQQRSLERLCVEKADDLAKELRSLSELSSNHAGLFRNRDDLEGVRVLLREANLGQRLEAALLEVDRLGVQVVRRCELDDERLRRIAQLDPLAWWAWPTQRS